MGGETIGQPQKKLQNDLRTFRTVEDEIIVDPVESLETVYGFELGQDEEANKEKLRRHIYQYKIELWNPYREGKKLLVLDIDYTLFEHCQ